jgi:4-carboxymuconolactone decarboxylase
MTIETRHHAAPRVAPVDPPYAPDVAQSLAKWMPPGSGAEPLMLFRTLARHPLLSERMRPLGAALLGRGTIPLRARELLILRTCARCGAEYEWGVHVTAFAAAAGLDDDAIRATLAPEPVLASESDALLFRFADELHDTATVSDAVWTPLAAKFSDAELLEMIAIAGFYHLISFTVNAARTPREAWAASFKSAHGVERARIVG